ncbi:MAG TPA: arylmalonate decarboxylase [Stellaceae bacterium]|nr:arylmalonate decarboxylase [Stellaceae bacterium]
MPDLLGYRAKLAVVVPSTNTTMEPEMHAMAPRGVTFHTARIYLAQPSIRSPEEAQRAAQAFRDALQIATRDVMTAEPDHLLIGVSALSFMGGVAGRNRFEEGLRQMANVDVTTAAGALAAALPLFKVKRIGILSPHPPMFDEHYVRFLTESGYEVAKLHRIDCPTTLAIAMVDEATIRAGLRELCDSGAEAIVQVGTDLVMMRLADEAERWLGRPVLAVNAAMLWHALRACSIPDRLPGLGSLLHDH